MAVVQDGWLYFVLIPLYVSVHDGEYTHCRIKNAYCVYIMGEDPNC